MGTAAGLCIGGVPRGGPTWGLGVLAARGDFLVGEIRSQGDVPLPFFPPWLQLVCEDVNVDRFYPVLYPKVGREHLRLGGLSGQRLGAPHPCEDGASGRASTKAGGTLHDLAGCIGCLLLAGMQRELLWAPVVTRWHTRCWQEGAKRAIWAAAVLSGDSSVPRILFLLLPGAGCAQQGAPPKSHLSQGAPCSVVGLLRCQAGALGYVERRVGVCGALSWLVTSSLLAAPLQASRLIVTFDEHVISNNFKFGVIYQKLGQVGVTALCFLPVRAEDPHQGRNIRT